MPYIEAKNSSAVFEHEATTSKISEDMLFYCRQRGMSAEEATALVVNGFVKDVLQQLPMEFAVEAQKLISICLEGSWRAKRADQFYVVVLDNAVVPEARRAKDDAELARSRTASADLRSRYRPRAVEQADDRDVEWPSMASAPMQTG